jgi:hypothetical protein
MCSIYWVGKPPYLLLLKIAESTISITVIDDVAKSIFNKNSENIENADST